MNSARDDRAAVRVGADVYDMYPVVDTIAHEYSTGGRAGSSSTNGAGFSAGTSRPSIFARLA